MIRVVLVAMLLLALGAPARADIVLRADAAPTEGTIADTIVLRITASVPTGWVLGEPTPTLAPDRPLGPFSILSAARRPPVFTDDGRVSTEFTIALSPGLPGEATIPPITFTARPTDTIAEATATTTAIPIAIRSVLAAPDAAQFEPGALRSPLAPPRAQRMPRTMLVGLGIAAATAVATALGYAWIHRRPPAPSRLDTALAELDALARAEIPTTEIARSASAIVRTTLADRLDPRFRTCAAGAESEILLKSIPALPPDDRLAIATFLADAERLACAPITSTPEAARLLESARACVRIPERTSPGGAP